MVNGRPTTMLPKMTRKSAALSIAESHDASHGPPAATLTNVRPARLPSVPQSRSFGFFPSNSVQTIRDAEHAVATTMPGTYESFETSTQTEIHGANETSTDSGSPRSPCSSRLVMAAPTSRLGSRAHRSGVRVEEELRRRRPGEVEDIRDRSRESVERRLADPLAAD